MFLTTTEMTEDFFKPLEDMNIAFAPYWQSTATCGGVFIPIGDKKKAGIRIKRVPDAHRALLAFCQAVQTHFKLKLIYCGESAAALPQSYPVALG